MQQRTDFSPKKWPRQQRSRATFEALVEACARLLPKLGYAGVTTNHIADTAGVGIASLYEYFPDKDAIVAQVAERLVARVMVSLDRHISNILAAGPRNGMTLWIERIYETLLLERELVAVFVREVPFTNRLPAVRNVTSVLMTFSEDARVRSGAVLDHPREELYLIINLVSSTIMQLVLEPPSDISTQYMKTVLAERVADWLNLSGEGNDAA